MSTGGLIAIRQSGPLANRKVETFRLSQGAAFDLTGDIALNTAHRQIVSGNPHNVTKFDVGLGGVIDYANPITLDSTQTIKPTAGQYFLSPNNIVELQGSAGELFKPTQTGATSRRIWGRGGGALIIVTIDTTDLGIGEPFEVAAENGERRVLMMDAGGDIVKIGGDFIPCSFAGETAVPQNFVSGGWNAVSLENEVEDYGGVFDDITSIFSPIRPGRWRFYSMAGVKADTGTLTRLISAVLVAGSPQKVFSDVRPGSVVANNPLRDPGNTRKDALFTVTPGISYQYGILANTDLGTYTILGDASTAKTTFSGEEIPGW